MYANPYMIESNKMRLSYSSRKGKRCIVDTLIPHFYYISLDSRSKQIKLTSQMNVNLHLQACTESMYCKDSRRKQNSAEYHMYNSLESLSTSLTISTTFPFSPYQDDISVRLLILVHASKPTSSKMYNNSI